MLAKAKEAYVVDARLDGRHHPRLRHLRRDQARRRVAVRIALHSSAHGWRRRSASERSAQALSRDGLRRAVRNRPPDLQNKAGRPSPQRNRGDHPRSDAEEAVQGSLGEVADIVLDAVRDERFLDPYDGRVRRRRPRSAVNGVLDDADPRCLASSSSPTAADPAPESSIAPALVAEPASCSCFIDGVWCV